MVYAELAGVKMRIRMDGNVKVRAGETLAVGLDPTGASVFDTAAEMRL